MKLLLKTALDESQFAVREKIKSDLIHGYEIHLHTFDINEKMLEVIKHKGVRIIHSPLGDKSHEFLSYFVNNYDTPEYANLVSTAIACEAPIVVHNDISDELIRSQEWRAFIEYLKLSNVQILVENSSWWGEYSAGKSNVVDRFYLCELINVMTERKCAFPITDICHLMMDNAIRLDNFVNVKQVIIDTLKMDGHIHMNYLHGDGIGKNHGLGFDSNVLLFHSIIKLIVECEKVFNVNPLITLEFNEADILKPERAAWAVREIESILKELP